MEVGMLTRFLFAAAVFVLAGMPATAGAPDTFGSGVSLEEVTPLARVIQQPEGFEGKIVRVEGVVTAVCAHMGCWMALAASDAPGGQTVLLKVDDGVVVFPVTAKGRRAAAQGVVERVGGSAEGREAAAEHARETNQSGRATPAGWQIKTTGAVLY
jgi:hypothetical protein